MSTTTEPQAKEELTTTQTARILGCSSQNVLRLARAGRLPHRWTPLGRLFPAAQIRALVEPDSSLTE